MRQRDGLVFPPPQIIAAKPVDARVKFDVLHHRQVFVEAELLRHITDSLANLGGLRHAIEAEHRASAFGRSKQAAKRFDQLPPGRVVRAEYAENFALFDRYVHAVDGGEIAETNCEVLSGYCCIHNHSQEYATSPTHTAHRPLRIAD